MFKEIANRDAWSTIRGYVYQVDLTILRWLQLDENTVLQLERGEDIDIVNRDLTKLEVSRELEQIKYRETNVTLNNETVLETLLNFHIQRQNNSGQNLLFRFVTNSDYGIERPAIFQQTGEAAIKVWTSLFQNADADDKTPDVLIIKKHLAKKYQEQIDDLIQKKGKQEDIDQLTSFKAFLDAPAGFADFLHTFEWSLKNEDAKGLSAAIEKALTVKRYVTDASHAASVYPRLFLYVFKLLTNKGLKQLTLADLQSEIKLPALSATDQKLFESVVALANEINERVASLEAKMEGASTSIKELAQDFAVLAKSDSVFELALNNLSTEPPPGIRNGSTREIKVKEVLLLCSKYDWISFQGINGTGKSQLAALVSQQYAKHYWLELRPYLTEPDKAAIILLKFLEYISSEPIHRDKISWIKTVVLKLPKDSIIILNDLPELVKDSTLAQTIVNIKNALTNGCKLLSTSNFTVPHFVKDQIDEKTFVEYNDLRFSDDEIIEYIINAGGDKSLAAYVPLISAVTDKNPRLVGAVIRDLQRINWGRDSGELFEVFFNKNFKNDVLDDAQKSINRFITNEQSRELLYRMSLFHWPFTFEEVQNICSVEAVISYPNERLTDILNTWVQEHRTKLYQVSPLIYDLGKKNLSAEVFKNTHLAVASNLIKGKKIDPITASRSIVSFLQGQDYLSAGGILLSIYQSVKTQEDVKNISEWGFLDYWSEADIPMRMPVVLRSYLRGEQLRLSREKKEKVPFLLSQLEQYLLEDGLSETEKVLIHFTILANFDKSNLDRFWYHIDEVAKMWTGLPQGHKDAVGIDNLTNILWLPTVLLSRPEEIRKWLAIGDQFEALFAKDIFENDISEIAVTGICHTISRFKHTGVKNEEIVELYCKLIERFRKSKREVLEALATRALVENLFTEQSAPDNAQKLADEVLASFTNPISKFIITDVLGKLYWNNKEPEKGRKYLTEAVAFQAVDQVNFVETLLYAAVSTSDVDSSSAQVYCKQAVELAEAKQDYHELDCILALCECSIACYKNQNYADAYSYFKNAVNRLFSVKEKVFAKDDVFYPKTEWIKYYVLSAHVVGYYSNVLAHGVVPKTGGEDFTKPFQGMFLFQKSDLSDLYKITNDPILLSEMALFAEGVDEITQAYSWAVRAFDLARKNGKDDILLMVSTMCLEYSLVNGKYDEAFESHLLFAALSTHLKGDSPQKYEGFKNSSIAEVLKEKPSEDWNRAEDTTVDTAIIPMFMDVLLHKISNTENANQLQEKFLKLLYNYIEDASDKELWHLLYFICDGVLKRKLSRQEIIDFGNSHSKTRRTLHAVSLLGLIFYKHKEVSAMNDLLNIYPHFANTFDRFGAIKKYICLPFLKAVCESILKNNFVGSKDEINEKLKQLKEIPASADNNYQLCLQIVVAAFEDDVKIQDDRKRWLIHFEVI
ncbi:MAG: hypothetical protein JST26_00175 [Bacteroidetes bacterium]|nr:hypothetical protein [Bacteroidota bacterium]